MCVPLDASRIGSQCQCAVREIVVPQLVRNFRVISWPPAKPFFPFPSPGCSHSEDLLYECSILLPIFARVCCAIFRNVAFEYSCQTNLQHCVYFICSILVLRQESSTNTECELMGGQSSFNLQLLTKGVSTGVCARSEIIRCICRSCSFERVSPSVNVPFSVSCCFYGKCLSHHPRNLCIARRSFSSAHELPRSARGTWCAPTQHSSPTLSSEFIIVGTELLFEIYFE